MSLDAHTDQKAAGERVEADVVQVVDELEAITDRDAHADARASEAISPTEDMPFVGICVVERDDPVEIKSAMVRIQSSGSRQQRGRYYLRRDQHEWLLDERGVYLFAICEPTTQRRILARKIVPAAEVEDLRNDWKEPADRAPYDQLAWSRVFDPDEVNRGEQA